MIVLMRSMMSSTNQLLQVNAGGGSGLPGAGGTERGAGRGRRGCPHEPKPHQGTCRDALRHSVAMPGNRRFPLRTAARLTGIQEGRLLDLVREL